MKHIGILGGFGPEATMDYYRRIIDFARQQQLSLSTPEIIILSADLAELLRLVGDADWECLTEWLAQKIRALEHAGADFAAISANTPHVVFDQLAAKCSLPLVSIVDATCEHIKSLGLKKLGLLGTKFTMESSFFSDRLAQSGILVAVPDMAEQALIHHKIITELELGIFSGETRRAILSIIDRMTERVSIDGIILGCTELPLLLSQADCDLPLINTTEVHVSAICRHWANTP